MIEYDNEETNKYRLTLTYPYMWTLLVSAEKILNDYFANIDKPDGENVFLGKDSNPRSIWLKGSKDTTDIHTSYVMDTVENLHITLTYQDLASLTRILLAMLLKYKNEKIMLPGIKYWVEILYLGHKQFIFKLEK